MNILIFLFLSVIKANYFDYNLDGAQNLTLINNSNMDMERIIYINDIMLVEVDGEKYAGTFLGSKDNLIYIENKSIFTYTAYPIKVDEIDRIYLGIGRTFKEIRDRWGFGLAILILPGMFEMADETDNSVIQSKAVRSLISWGLFGTIGYLVYGNLLGGIDYQIRKANSQKFIIGPNDWFIKNE
mgnify:CR=1 FL=1